MGCVGRSEVDVNRISHDGYDIVDLGPPASPAASPTITPLGRGGRGTPLLAARCHTATTSAAAMRVGAAGLGVRATAVRLQLYDPE